jgi:hypothetical protein
MMKKATTLALLFGLAAGGAYAAPHGFQQQIGASELDPSIWEGGKITVNAPTERDFTPSVYSLYLSANVDGIAPLDFNGNIEPGGPTRISLYEVYRGTSEGTGYASYYDQFPLGGGESAVAKAPTNRDGHTCA